MTAQTSAPIATLEQLLAERASAGQDVAVLRRRGRWLVVNRAVSHAADLPLGVELAGAPADMNGKPWRVRVFSELHEQERLDALASVTVCYCCGAQNAVTHCAYCAGTRKPELPQLRDGDVVEWQLHGRPEESFRLSVVSDGALRRVSLRALSLGQPNLFTARPTPKLRPRFSTLLVTIDGEQWLVSRRVGPVALAQRLSGPGQRSLPSTPAAPRERRGGWGYERND